MIDVNNEIVKQSKKIAVSLSGGADSAILFYHACDVLSDKTFYPFSGYDTRRPDSIFYAMEVYQFFKDESKNDGEYILLTGLEEINGIKMPKNRAWYYNNNDGYLGTDYLSSKE